MRLELLLEKMPEQPYVLRMEKYRKRKWKEITEKKTAADKTNNATSKNVLCLIMKNWKEKKETE